MAELCALCQTTEGIADCDVCNNVFCIECLESHTHCSDCGGTGVKTIKVMRNAAGELDFLHGVLTGETYQEPCRRCEGTRIET